jgi:DnaK suppressor protein
MVKKKSFMDKALAAAKKVIAKPAAKKVIAKPAAKKIIAKPAAKKVIAKPAAKKIIAKPAAKKVMPKSAAKKVMPKPNSQQFKQFQTYTPKSKEKYMSKSQREHFMRILNVWKNELSKDIDRTVAHMQDDITAYADPNDRASQESDMALELRNRDRERKLIKKIDQTLKIIASDDYGYCKQCGEEIGLNRLQARPTATLCIDCKTLDEIREKQMAK